MTDGNATLLAHCGAKYVTREQLKGFAEPEPLGRTHKPIHHYTFATTLVEVLADNGLTVADDRYAVMGGPAQDAVIFGVMNIDPKSEALKWGDPTRRPSLGFRGANDQSMKREIAVGTNLFVCDNMAFDQGLISLARKHTIGFDLKRDLGTAVERYLAQTTDLTGRIERAAAHDLTDEAAKALILDAFCQQKVMPVRFLPTVVHDYFEPDPEWTDITENAGKLWGVHNAFTRSARELRPRQRFEATVKLGDMLALASAN